MSGLCRCPACLAPRPYLFLPMGEHPPASMLVRRAELGEVQPAFPLDAHACLACGLIHVPNRLPRDFFVRHLRLTAAAPLGGADQDLTDIALSLAKGGWIAELEPDPGKVAPEFKILVNPFDAAKQCCLRDEHGPPRVIVAGECLERTEDLHSLLQMMSELLAPDGVLITETRWACAALRDNAFDALSAEHLSLFSLHSLAAAGSFFGLVPVDVAPTRRDAGVLRTIFRRRGSEPSAAVAALLEEEAAAGILRAETYDAFADRASTLRDRLLRLIWTLRSEGKHVVGYGVSEAGHTLMNFCGIGRAELDYIVNPDSCEDQLFTPGMKVPIKPPAAMNAAPADVLLMVDNSLAGTVPPPLSARSQLLIALPQPRLVG